ncbi:MAG: hypothetical protein V4644_00450 [Patescibacteria group bacterium]
MTDTSSAPRRASRHADLLSIAMLLIFLGTAYMAVTKPSIELWLAVPVLVFLDGLRVEFADYIEPHAKRNKLAEREIIFGFITLVALALLIPVYAPLAGFVSKLF